MKDNGRAELEADTWDCYDSVEYVAGPRSTTECLPNLENVKTPGSGPHYLKGCVTKQEKAWFGS